MNPYLPAIGATILPNLGGIAGGYFTRKSIKNWYDQLKKPEWRPPNWSFGPVWTTLYCGMGYASFLVFKEGGGCDGAARLPLMMFGAQLALNWAWTPLFFGLHQVKWAFYEIIVLDAAVVATGLMFAQVNKTAGLLFVPYAIWMALATALSYTIYRDNPDADKIKEI